MRLEEHLNWRLLNQQYMRNALIPIYHRLQQHVSPESSKQTQESVLTPMSPIEEENNVQASSSPLFEVLCKRFNLSDFERKLLLLCVGAELDVKFAALCEEAPANLQRQYPTLNLALALFEAEYSHALEPESPLRNWNLIEMGKGPTLLLNPLRINERIFHYVMGDARIDKQLAAIIKPIDEIYLIPSHQAIAKQIVEHWSNEISPSSSVLFNLYGTDLSSKQNVAKMVSKHFGCSLYQLNSYELPNDVTQRVKLIDSLIREAALHQILYLLVCDEPLASDSYRHYVITTLLKQLRGMCILATLQPFRPTDYPINTLEVKQPTRVEQLSVWQSLLKDHSYPLERLVEHYDFNVQQIQSICGALLLQSERENQEEKSATLWQVCQSHSRKELEGLIQRIECKTDWHDIVLPPQQRQILQEIIRQASQRHKVYHQWGFADKSARGLGISALFAGPSGTGKTLAAEVIAKQLQVDLYHIDLSAVVSKYIGETEKNLKKVFDLAEGSGAVLLFDEADALFGKRSEVKDSHDRHANIEISYLLQRMEAYRGLSILTTNLKNALDSAFMRRIRFVINFPFPEQAQRLEIWQRVFPKQTPLHQLDINKLARLTLAGGDIRNIALGAAFLAAEADEPVMMQHLLQATQNEYLKLGKSLNNHEIKDWV